MATIEKPVLEVEDLKVEFDSGGSSRPVVSGVSLKLARGRTLGLVGESGCGKTVTALSILRLIPDPPGRITGGRILFEGRDLTKLHPRELSGIRGRRISMVFQEPMTSLNPVFTVGDQVAEVYRAHLSLGKKESMEKAVEMLERVGIPDPSRRARQYPHHLSGGMRQRALIAIALACSPDVLIADEPTTALDVTVQAQILELIERLREDMGASVLLITHDFSVIAETADDVAIMYAGRVVEEASCRKIFRHPRHPYTAGLLRSRPSGTTRRGGAKERLEAIPGTVPSPGELPPGCSFEPRCPRSEDRCRHEMPNLEAKAEGHLTRCWFPLEEERNNE